MVFIRSGIFNAAGLCPARVFSLRAFQLTLQSVQAEIKRLFKTVGGLGGEKLSRCRNMNLYTCLFVHGSLGLNEGVVDVNISDGVETARELVKLLIGELQKFVGDIEMDSLDIYLHNQ